MPPPTDTRTKDVAGNASLVLVAGRYEERPVLGPLAGQLACTWTHALSPSLIAPLQVVPDGCIDIIWTGETIRVAGPDTGPVIESLPSGARIVGVRFRPGAASPWLGVPASEILDRRLPLADFWGTDARRLADRLSEAPDPIAASDMVLSALLARGRTQSLIDDVAPAVFNALTHNDGTQVNMTALAVTLGVSERTLRRRCETAFGYGPKTLDRILRFQRFLRLLRHATEPRLADIAAASGFADQAHLTRDVRRLGGLTPGGFLAQLTA